MGTGCEGQERASPQLQGGFPGVGGGRYCPGASWSSRFGWKRSSVGGEGRRHLPVAGAVGQPTEGRFPRPPPAKGWPEGLVPREGESGKLNRGGGGGSLEVAWHQEEGNARGSPLGLWGHTEPEKLVLRSLRHGNFTCDRPAHPTTRRGVLNAPKLQLL